MKLRLTSRAARDLTGIAQYIEQVNPAAARRVVQRIERTHRLIQRSPLIGRHSARPHTHEFPVTGLPLLIVYRIVGDTVEVLTIFHTSQDPDKK
jgi:plasmid stabilization system protein ParE